MKDEGLTDIVRSLRMFKGNYKRKKPILICGDCGKGYIKTRENQKMCLPCTNAKVV